MADFYAALSRYYDELFPADPDTVRFLEGLAEAGPGAPLARVLDAACGTGSYTLELARRGCRAAGVDLDGSMIERARRKLAGAGPATEARFLRGDMLQLPALCPGPWDLVFCIGNSLVHLDGEAEVGRMLSGCRSVLRPGGRLALQIINYDRVLARRIVALPELAPAGASVRLVREYRWAPGDRKVRFATELTAVEAGRETRVRGGVDLLILRAGTLQELAEAAGFRQVGLFGDFEGGAWTPDSFLTVVTASSPSNP